MEYYMDADFFFKIRTILTICNYESFLIDVIFACSDA